MLHQFKIAQKLIMAFVVVSVIASIAGVASVVMMKNIDAQYSDALVNYGFAQGDIGKTLASFSQLDGYVHDAVSYVNDANQQQARRNMQENIQKVPQYLSAMEPSLQSEEAKELFRNANSLWNSYLSKAGELSEAANTTDSTVVAMVQERLVAELDPLYDELYSTLAALMDNKVEGGNTLSDRLSNFAGGSVLLTIVLIVAAMAVSITFGAFIARTISRPVSACTKRIELLAKGDLDSPVPAVSSEDETGKLSAATETIVWGLKRIVDDIIRLLDAMGGGDFAVKTSAAENYIGDFVPILTAMRRINSRLSDTVRQIGRSADQVASGSEQVSSGAQALSQGATEQASSVQELAATITEISQQVNTNAGSARQGSGMAASVGSHTQESNQRMQEMLGAMGEISDSSGEIGKIIKTIEDIAFQTNILALNAAVEAARAGAAGKGFAVVADEVRNLANKSQEASSNTAALIERSLRAVENGRRLADETAAALGSVLEGMQSVSDTIGQISSASEQQAQSISQVTVGIDQISAVVQTNSATAEESAAASEELSSQAQMLKDLVAQFRLKEEGETVGIAILSEKEGTGSERI